MTHSLGESLADSGAKPGSTRVPQLGVTNLVGLLGRKPHKTFFAIMRLILQLSSAIRLRMSLFDVDEMHFVHQPLLLTAPSETVQLPPGLRDSPEKCSGVAAFSLLSYCYLATQATASLAVTAG